MQVNSEWLFWKQNLNCWGTLLVLFYFLLSCMHQPALSWLGKVDNSLILQPSPSRAGSPRPHTWNIGVGCNYLIILINAPVKIRTRDLWLRYHIELHAPTSSTQQLKLIGKGGQFTYTPTLSMSSCPIKVHITFSQSYHNRKGSSCQGFVPKMVPGA
jgi:hypothetical protein